MTRRNGFSLIEMMVVIAIVGVLLLIGTPSFKSWMNNARIRSATESIQNGLRTARNEAAQRATPVRFELASSTAPTWQVCQVATGATDCTGGTTIERRDATEQQLALSASTKAADQATPSTLLAGGVPAGITFDALARPTSFGVTSISRIDVAGTPTVGRRLVVLISSGGMVRACDPETVTLSNADAQSCKTN